MDKKHADDWRFDAHEANSRYAAEMYGDRMYQTDPHVAACRRDRVEPPATQTVDDTREWCLEHET